MGDINFFFVICCKFATFVALKVCYMKYSELLKCIKEAGCYLIRHGSNHDIWYSPKTQKKFPFPRHLSKEVAKNTEKSIKEAAGI